MIEPQTPPGPFVITSEYLDYLIGILTGTVAPKAGAEYIPVLEVARMALLGAAWAEAVEAIPEGWRLCIHGSFGSAAFKAVADSPDGMSLIEYSAPTPIAALRALTGKLRMP